MRRNRWKESRCTPPTSSRHRPQCRPALNMPGDFVLNLGQHIQTLRLTLHTEKPHSAASYRDDDGSYKHKHHNQQLQLRHPAASPVQLQCTWCVYMCPTHTLTHSYTHERCRDFRCPKASVADGKRNSGGSCMWICRFTKASITPTILNSIFWAIVLENFSRVHSSCVCWHV